ncbi:hypothetical protein GCM10027422_24000 [Hymenobacter arcticus]
MKKIATLAAKLGFQKEVISHLSPRNAGGQPNANQTTDGTTSGTGGQTTVYCFITNLL